MEEIGARSIAVDAGAASVWVGERVEGDVMGAGSNAVDAGVASVGVLARAGMALQSLIQRKSGPQMYGLAT